MSSPRLDLSKNEKKNDSTAEIKKQLEIKVPQLSSTPDFQIRVGVLSEKDADYIHIRIDKNKQFPFRIKGILALDMDGTLLNYDETIKQNNDVFINEQLIKQCIDDALAKDFLVICITSRYFMKDFIEEPIRTTFAIESLKKLHAGISDIYYTNAKTKAFVLQHFAEAYCLAKNTICLLDDLYQNITECVAEGFIAIPVEVKLNIDYIHYLKEFLNNSLTKNEKYHNYLYEYIQKTNLTETFSSPTSNDICTSVVPDMK